MIKRIVSILTLLSIALYISAQTKVFIPDTNFRNFLNDDYPSLMDSTGDSLITAQAALFGGNLVCYAKGIQDLTGIEYFKNIQGLICSNNMLTTLPPLDSLASLKYLYCNSNPITSLPDLSGNVSLLYLQCYYTLLTSLPDLSANTSLIRLDCFSAQLTSLPDLSANVALMELSCGLNQLTALPDLTSNVALRKLYCQYNQILLLPDLSTNVALEILDCRNNQIPFLPSLAANTALEVLHCDYNQLTALPGLGTNIALRDFRCDNNQLIALPNLSSNTALEWIDCSYNQLTVLPDLSNNLALEWIECHHNQLTVLPDFYNDTVLISIRCYDNKLTSIPDLSTNTALQYFDCRNNKLDFSDAKNLRVTDSICYSNVYSTLIAPQNPFGQAETHNLLPGDTLTLSIASQDSALYYQWFRGTNIVGEGPSDSVLVIPNVTSADAGIYTCRTYGDALQSPPMHSSPGLNGFVSEPFTVTLPVGIQENTDPNSLVVYPNPSNGQFTVEVNSTPHEQIEFRIVNILGQTVFLEMKEPLSGTFRSELNIEGYGKGIYLLQVTDSKGAQSKKIVVN